MTSLTKADIAYLATLGSVLVLTLIGFAVMSRNKPPPPKK